MKKNLSILDSTARALIAILIGVLYLNNIITGTLGIILIGVAIILLFTSFFGFCPLYWLLGISTCSTKKKRLEN